MRWMTWQAMLAYPAATVAAHLLQQESGGLAPDRRRRRGGRVLPPRRRRLAALLLRRPRRRRHRLQRARRHGELQRPARSTSQILLAASKDAMLLKTQRLTKCWMLLSWGAASGRP